MATPKATPFIFGVILLLGTIATLPTASATVYSEDFEDETNGAAPTESYYTWTNPGASCAATVCGVRLRAGSEQLKASDSAATANLGMLTYNSVDVCANPASPGAQVGIPDSSYSWTFDFDLDSAPTGAMYVGIGRATAAAPISSTVSSADGGFFGIQILQSTMVASTWMTPKQQQAVAASGAFTPALTWVLDQPYRITMDRFTCRESTESSDEDSGFHVHVVNLSDSSAYDATLSVSTTWDLLTIGTLMAMGANGAANTASNSFIDNIAFDDGVVGEISNTEISVSNLVGYSMDATGRAIITREDFGDTVRTYDAVNLDPPGATDYTGEFATPDCGPTGGEAMTDGVFAAKHGNEIYTTFFDCNAAGDTSQMWIKGPQLNTPTFDDCGTGLGEEELSDDDFDPFIDGPFEMPSTMRQLGDLSDSSIAFNHCNSSGVDWASVAWTYSTTSGRVGVYGVVIVDTGPGLYKSSHRDDVLLDASLDGASLGTSSFCSWAHNSNGNDYFGAVSVTGSTAFYQGDFDPNVQGTTAFPESQVSEEYLNSGGYAHAYGIGCANDDALLIYSGTVTALHGVLAETNNANPSVLWQKTVSGGKLRGAQVSSDGTFGFYAVTDGIHVVWMNNGTEIRTLGYPAGSYRGMDSARDGSKLAVFTSSKIRVYNLSNITCEETVTGCNALLGNDDEFDEINPPSTTTTGTSGACSSILCADSSSVPHGFTVAAFNGFLGLILTTVIAVGGTTAIYADRPGAKMSGGVIGAFLLVGYLVALFFGLLPMWPLVLVAIVGVAAIVQKVRSGG